MDATVAQTDTPTHLAAGLLSLKGYEPIAAGRRQFVYEHPSDPSVLVKVMKPGKKQQRDRYRLRRILDRIRFGEGFTDFMRELREYLELRTRCPENDGRLPLCAVLGIVETDLGIGLLYERISNPDGSLAPALGDLVEAGKVEQQHLDDLTRHFEILREMRVVLSNFNMLNLVYQTHEDGTGHYVWIDSTGCKQKIPMRRWFKRLNDRKLNKIEAHFRAALTNSLAAWATKA